MRHIIVNASQAFIDDTHGYAVDTSELSALGIAFVGEDRHGLWFEKDVFQGPERDNAAAEKAAREILAAAEKKHADNQAMAEDAGRPTRVSAFQAFAALDESGLLDDVEAYMASPDTPRRDRLAFEKAQEFRRSSPTVAKLAEHLQLSEAQVDDLFARAAQIEA